MTKKNNVLTGQGLAHPENEQQFNFADLIPVISGVIGRQPTSEVNNSQSSAAKRTPFQRDISLKNAHGASSWKAGNPAKSYQVVFSRYLLVVSGNAGDHPKEKSADCGHALWVSSAEYFADVKSAKNLADHFSPFNCLASCCAMPTSSLRWSPACTPISPMRSSASSAPLRLVKSLSSPLSLSWRRAISPRAAHTRKAAVDSPPVLAASISSKTSWGIRIDICLDLSLLVFDAMSTSIHYLCDSVYTIINHNKCLPCDFVCYSLNHTLSTSKSQGNYRGNDKQHYQHIDRSPVHAFHHQHWRHSYGLAGRRKHSISNCDAGAFQGAMCASCHENWRGIKTAKPGSVGALNRASNQSRNGD